jgi:hypothetical protein
MTKVIHKALADTANARTMESIIDRFEDDRPFGAVIGTRAAGNVVRKGVDPEGVVGIDNGALRIRPLNKPRWGKSGIAYGPFTRRNGLAFGAFLLNGHNTSQAEPLIETFRLRLQRWALGSETDKPLTRILRCLCGRQRKFLCRRFWQWFRTGSRFFRVDLLNENLAVGWFPSEAPGNPLAQGNSFIMHALGPECGGLWARTGSASLEAVRGLQNVPVYYFVVLRERGAAYYAASIPGVPGLAAHPHMRLLAIDALNEDKTVFAGVHQSVLGQIGFRAETRVYRTQVITLPGFDKWYGSAHGADALTGEGSLALSSAEAGGNWQVHEGGFQRTAQGLVATEAANAATLELGLPAGLVHVLIKTTDQAVEGVGIIWRAKDEDNFWCFEAGSRQCQLAVKEKGVWSRFPATQWHRLAPNALNSLQVTDDGEDIRLHLNGELVYATSFTDRRLQDGRGVGIQAAGVKAASLRSFEAHPREIPVPKAFDLGKPWLAEGSRIVVSDDFQGSAADLAGRATPMGDRTWRKEMGKGVIQLTGSGAAKVLGTVEKPCPGRTAYTVDWPRPELADVEVRITPPGIQRGNHEKGRGGLIFWQDDRNYITWTVFVDDWYGTSIAAFFHVDGFEELYDAVWTNVGKRIHWGVPYDFRVVCDGKQFLAFVNGEPVLYRALSDIYPDWDHLNLHRVGIVANWEWGNDTGSRFEKFVAKDKV